MTTAPPAEPRSPVTRAELLHLQRHARGRFADLPTQILQGWLIASVVLTGCLLLLGRSGQTTVNIRETYGFFSDILRVLNLSLIAVIIAYHILLLWQTLLFAAATISREHQSGTWEPLILTPMTARQIIVGKWWAVMLHVMSRHGRGILLRGGALLWLGVTPAVNRVLLDAPNVFMLIIAPTVLLLFTLLSLMLAAALGVTASAARFPRLAGLLLVSGVLSLLLAVDWAAYRLFMNFSDGSLLFLGPVTGASDPLRLTLVFADGGALLSLDLLTPLFTRTSALALAKLLPGLLLYPLLTLALLLLAARLSRIGQ